MKSLYILIFFVSVTAFAQAQKFAPIGAKWVYSMTYQFYPNNNYVEVNCIGDTLIEGKNCQIITSPQGDGLYNVSITDKYVYSNSDTIFIYDTALHEFGVFQVFNAQVGDEWAFIYTNNSTDYNSGSIPDTMHFHVDSNTVAYVNGDTQRVVHTTTELHCSNGGTPTFFQLFNSFNERIGDVNFPFYVDGCLGISDLPFIRGLRCYSDAEIGSYETGIVDSCYYVYNGTSVEEINAENAINVWPNPAHEMLNVELVEGVEALRLINSNGQEVLVQQVSKSTSTQTLQLNLSALPAGIYQLVATSNQKVLARTVVKD
ncbi:MAG: hypothetical protein CL843_04390 [Crocinitomicaceae bacterium]|nr:hypothetical protein [Crocinitomicaceae bacterium]